jgi:hypothetical protein
LNWISSVILMSPLTEQESEAICGGARLPRLSGLNLLGRGGGNSIFNQVGTNNVNNVGNTGFSLLSIGAIYL